MTTPSIPIIFDNQTSNTLWVQFLNGSFGPGQTGANGSVSLSGDTAYNIANLSSALPAFPELGEVPNVALNDFTNGRIYFNYGSAGLQSLGAGYQPSPNNSQDTNFTTTYAYIELNVFGNENNNMDLSAIDFFSMPIEASTWRDGNLVNKLTCTSGAQIGSAVEILMGLSNNEAVVNSSENDFVRVIGPGLASGYHDWTAYLTFLSSLKYATVISGNFAGLQDGSGTTAAQTYDLEASVDPTSLQVTLKGSASVVGDTTITINATDLNAMTGVYGANPPYTINNGGNITTTNGIVNDVFGWIVGDLLAGMHMGFPGSTTLNPNNGIALGLCTSSEWFSAAQEDPSLQFSGAQSNANYYNPWAATLLPETSAYGFPFTDRLGGVLLYFPPTGSTGAVDYLKISFLDMEFPA